MVLFLNFTVILLLRNHVPAKIEEKNNLGLTPLHLAADNGHLNIVQTLLNHGVNPDCTDKWGIMPLMRAAKNNHMITCCQLVQEKANFFRCNFAGEDALTLAQEKGNEPIVLYLKRFYDQRLHVWSMPRVPETRADFPRRP